MTAELDLVVRGGLVVDGTGLARRRVDIGVRDGRVATVGHLDGRAAREVLDADGRIVAPGIVDAHTHYDPQITFDPYATVSCFHGVTTVLAGNCGFSVAPCRADDRAFLSGIFARVENMDPIALSAITWDDFETFPEFLASRAGRLGVNLACYVGHSNVRRWVMGPDASSAARDRRRDRRHARVWCETPWTRAPPGCPRRPRPPTSTWRTGPSRRGCPTGTSSPPSSRRPAATPEARSPSCPPAPSAGSTPRTRTT